MKNYLPQMDENKLKRLFEIESDFKAGKLSAAEAHNQVEAEIGKVKAYHIAYVEQTMKEEHADECEREDLHALLNMLRDQMDTSLPEIPADHPISHYLKENKEMKRLLKAVDDLVQYPMIKNQWLELYDQISQYPVHFKRKASPVLLRPCGRLTTACVTPYARQSVCFVRVRRKSSSSSRAEWSAIPVT